jgi:hypothetical protein
VGNFFVEWKLQDYYVKMEWSACIFNIYRSMHRDIFPQCNQQDAPLSHIIYSCKMLYNSDGLSVHHQDLKIVCTATSICQTATATCCYQGRDGNCSSISSPIAAGSIGCLTYTCCCIRNFELLVMDGKTVRNM